MTMRYVITGASDDLIEIDGDVRDEFGGGDTPRYLLFSDGTVVCATYCPESADYPDGYPGWNIWIPTHGDRAKLTRTPIDDTAGDPDPYWDEVVVEGDIRFLGCFDTPEGPSNEWIYDWFEQNADDLTDKQKRAAFEARD